MTNRWFRRFADVPHVNYIPEMAVDRTALWGHDAIPEVHSYDYGGVRREFLSWPTRDALSTSAAPAKQWHTEPRVGESLAQTALRELHEVLELPGTIPDYHFAIAHCCEQLWQNRHGAPWTLHTIERLCWLDIQLCEAHPQDLTFEHGDGERRYPTMGYTRLLPMYSREGYLTEALRVAQRARDHAGDEAAREHFAAHVAALEAALEAEDAS
jgi:hypothetical protein